MILTGEGPVDPMRTATAKLFASFYALFSGVVFLAIWSILVVPVAHRLLHRLHLEGKERREDSKQSFRGFFFTSPPDSFRSAARGRIPPHFLTASLPARPPPPS